MIRLLFALSALLPMAAGPMQPEARAMTVELCSGVKIVIPLDGTGPDEPERPCHDKACHAGTCRKRFDQSQ